MATQGSTERIGEALKQSRLAAKKTQEEAASTLGVSRVAVSNYERGMLPEDFLDEKLPVLARLYEVSPESIIQRANSSSTLVSSWTVPPDEPLWQHIAKLPVPVQVWYHAFLSELLQLSVDGNISAGAIERAREELTFAQLDLWAGGDLQVADARRTLNALRWCAEATWRNVTEPGWLGKSRTSWKKLPTIFEVRSQE